jgi:hypothetical protein
MYQARFDGYIIPVSFCHDWVNLIQRCIKFSFKESIKLSNDGSDGDKIIGGHVVLDLLFNWKENGTLWYVVKSGMAIHLVSGKQFAVRPCISMPAEAVRIPLVHSTRCLGSLRELLWYNQTPVVHS